MQHSWFLNKLDMCSKMLLSERLAILWIPFSTMFCEKLKILSLIFFFFKWKSDGRKPIPSARVTISDTWTQQKWKLYQTGLCWTKENGLAWRLFVEQSSYKCNKKHVFAWAGIFPIPNLTLGFLPNRCRINVNKSKTKLQRNSACFNTHLLVCLFFCFFFPTLATCPRTWERTAEHPKR